MLIWLVWMKNVDQTTFLDGTYRKKQTSCWRKLNIEKEEMSSEAQNMLLWDIVVWTDCFRWHNGQNMLEKFNFNFNLDLPLSASDFYHIVESRKFSVVWVQEKLCLFFVDLVI